MTEQDALLHVQANIEPDLQFLSKLKTPSEILESVKGRFLQVLSLHIQDETMALCMQVAKSGLEVPPRNFSLQISREVSRIFEVVVDHESPEKIRAIMVWMCGRSGEGAGYMIRVLDFFKDTATRKAVIELTSMVSMIHRNLQAADSRLFDELVADLPRAQKSRINGMVMAAKWSAADEDFENADLKMMTARKLAKRLIKAKMIQDRVGV